MPDIAAIAEAIAEQVELAEARARHARFSARLAGMPKDDLLAAGAVVAHHRRMPGFEAEPTPAQLAAASRVHRRLRE